MRRSSKSTEDCLSINPPTRLVEKVLKIESKLAFRAPKSNFYLYQGVPYGFSVFCFFFLF